MKSLFAAMLLGVFAAFPVLASADTSPLVNRVIVDQALQQQMQNQINAQQTQLQLQQDLMRAGLQNELQQNTMSLQYILLEQQIQLLKLRQRLHARSAASHKARKRS